MMSGSEALPGQPSLNPVILNGLTGSSTLPSCIDVDQIVAQQVTHTCVGTTGQPSFCYEYNGVLANPGETEIYYATDNCTAIPACPGSLSVVSLNFNPPQNIACIGDNGASPSVVGSCDISNQTQLWRVTRTNPGSSAPGPSGTNTGLLAQILDRNTGNCLVPAGTIGPSGPTVGQLVNVSTCAPNNGFVWALIPSLQDPITMTIAPQQIGYVGGIKIPNFNSLIEVYTFILANNILTLDFQTGTGTVFLNTYATDLTNPDEKFQSAQYLDYDLYNIIFALGTTGGFGT